MTPPRPPDNQPPTTTRPASTTAGARRPKAAVAAPAGRRSAPRLTVVVALAALVVLLVVGGLYLAFRGGTGGNGGAGQGGAYQVGTPGVGVAAPGFTLPATAGAPVSLSSLRGKNVLLYFHEGLGCQPCWDQIRDLDAAKSQLTAAGIDQLVSITSGPVDLIAQKMADDKLTATALADTDLAVSRTYNANQFGMMGTDRDGHSFILVGPDGRIQWRADYGGAPNYTMYVPVAQLLGDLKAGRATP